MIPRSTQAEPRVDQYSAGFLIINDYYCDCFPALEQTDSWPVKLAPQPPLEFGRLILLSFPFHHYENDLGRCCCQWIILSRTKSVSLMKHN
jgi:hypothetical protein